MPRFNMSKTLQPFNSTRGLLFANQSPKYGSQISLNSYTNTTKIPEGMPARLTYHIPCQRSYHNSCACHFGMKHNEVDQTMVVDKLSNREAFQAIPVNQTVLQYIKTIGVGLRPRKNRKKFGRGPSGGRRVLSSSDEKIFFEGRRENRGSNKGLNQDSPSPSLLPPPPFSVSTSLDNDNTNDDASELGFKIRRLPVKILGSVASAEDEMPRSSKGLPEIIIAGRSNVGKSTLLNALLYGNHVSENETPEGKRYRYIRGKTPSGSKVPKGIKAIVSNRPGETRHIQLYQLSSEIIPRKQSSEVGDKIAKQKMSLIFADVPGFGFAFASEDKAKEWHRLMANFVLYRGKSLKRILLLIDARHGFKKADYDFLDSLQQELASNTKKKDGNQRGKRAIQLPPIQIVLTKCDLVTQNDLARRVVQVREQLSDALVREPSALPVMLVCAKAGLGYNNVRGNRARGGILELQRELAALVPLPRDHKQRHS